MSKEANKTQRALSLALEALKQMQAKANFECWNLEICDDAIKALEEALAKQEQGSTTCDKPVAWLSEGGNFSFVPYQCSTPLYTTPPQRTWERPWVSLTDEEIDYYIVHRCGVATKKNLVELIRLCEIKLKEKNT